MKTKSKPRVRLNLSGEPMQALGIGADGQRLMRRIRRKALRIGCSLRRFRQIYGYETPLGCAWVATCRRNPSLSVTIWQAMGEHDIAEARQTCHEVVETAHGVFGVSWCGNWPEEL